MLKKSQQLCPVEHDPTTTYGGNSMNNNEIMKC